MLYQPCDWWPLKQEIEEVVKAKGGIIGVDIDAIEKMISGGVQECLGYQRTSSEAAAIIVQMVYHHVDEFSRYLWLHTGRSGCKQYDEPLREISGLEITHIA